MTERTAKSQTVAVLKKIVVQDFRNIALQELEFSPKVNCISGNNGEGKTNLLDAVYTLSMTKSALASSDRFNIRYGTEEFRLGGLYSMPDGTESRVSVRFSSAGDKKVVRDEKAYGRISDHIGLIPVVMVSPSDSSLVNDSGAERRRFVNAVLSQMDREYLAAIQQYNRLLEQRNALLRDGSPYPLLQEVIDERMEPFARAVYEARKQFAASLSPIVSAYYRIISGGNEEVSIDYRSDLSRNSLSDLFRESVEKDRLFKYTTAGIQRDDLVFRMNGQPIRRGGSQGQQKSFLVALKFAEYDIMKGGAGVAPILLLDDVFDKLDIHRISNLISMVTGSGFSQIFITDCDASRLSNLVDAITDDRSYFETSGGTFTRVG